jgi:hypothetical protein
MTSIISEAIKDKFDEFRKDKKQGPSPEWCNRVTARMSSLPNGQLTTYESIQIGDQ